MATSPQQQRKFRDPRRRRSRSTQPGSVPWRWMVLTALLYASAGMILAAFPAPFWIWNLAVGGAIAQAMALAGPRALSRFTWLQANGLMLLSVVGTLAITIALAIALGYVGTDQLDQVELVAGFFEVVRVSLLALVVSALGAIISAETGDLLLDHFKRLEATLILVALCILGFGLGGVIGLLAAAD